MTHLWVREEPRESERRVGITPDGVAALRTKGIQVTVEDAPQRILPTHAYSAAGAQIVPAGHWRSAPDDAIIFGLKELPQDGAPLRHRHIMFGHAYKGQPAGADLLNRFQAGGGTLFDLEYLTDDTGRRVAAFGHWAGFVGAAITLLGWAKAKKGQVLDGVQPFASPKALIGAVQTALDGEMPSVLVIGALGRVGGGAAQVADQLGLPLTRWDIAETSHGGPFPEILDHDVFLNCILAAPGVPVFVPAEAVRQSRRLAAIGDIACDPDSSFSPIKVYSAVTSWAEPLRRVSAAAALDVMAIDNLPSLLPRESSEDFAGQLLPHLMALDRPDHGVWARAKAVYDRHAPVT